MTELLEEHELEVVEASDAFLNQHKFGPLAGIARIDDLLVGEYHKQVYEYLQRSGWEFGWKSDAKTDKYSFWHKHFAGNIHPDNYERGGREKPYECVEELRNRVPLLYGFWRALERSVFKGHRLVRCYANGQPYGSEGSVHTDSVSERSFTSIYYPHERWSPNWGGETVFFNKEKNDIVAAIYPRPNRFIIFPGTVPHAARGVSRSCPLLRITLMFKTEIVDA